MSSSRIAFERVTIAAVAAALLSASAGVAYGQASGCGELQKYLVDRKNIAERLQSHGKKQIDARVACSGFNQLVTNGTTLIKWSDTNKDWCQIPDSFMAGIKADHSKALEIRGKACSVAAKVTQMEKQAKEGGGSGGGLLGGGGLTGSTALPKGAL